MNKIELRIREIFSDSALESEIDKIIETWRNNKYLEQFAETASDRVVMGLVHLAFTSPNHARLLTQRKGLLTRILSIDLNSQSLRPQFEHRYPRSKDLEVFLDELRLFRRDETVVAAVADLAGIWSFDTTSQYLSLLAEEVVEQALHRAVSSRPSELIKNLAVISLGKLGGREFTYYSDLDLMFLHGGDLNSLDVISRCVQRFISYVSTMTGAGTAYVVDARLRPSGQQGSLVASFQGFEQYQLRKAAVWEHLALVRGRAIAGAIQAADSLLKTTRDIAFLESNFSWHEIEQMRQKVEHERAHDGIDKIHLKTGYGGLMDVEFLASGACLEQVETLNKVALPSIPNLFRASLGREPAILESYRFMRRVESRVRWVSGRSVDTIPLDKRKLSVIAELVSPGLTSANLLDQLHEARHSVRKDFSSVIEAESIRALA